MRRTFKVAKKEITFCTGKVDGADSLGYSEEINGKVFLFWTQTKQPLPKDAREAMEYIESLAWEINEEGDFVEN